MKKDENPRRLSRGRGQEHPERKPVFDFDHLDHTRAQVGHLAEQFLDLALESEVPVIKFGTRLVVAAELVFADDSWGGSELRLAAADMQRFDPAKIETLQDREKCLLSTRQVRFVRRARHGKKPPAIGGRTPTQRPGHDGGSTARVAVGGELAGPYPKGVTSGATMLHLARQFDFSRHPIDVGIW